MGCLRVLALVLAHAWAQPTPIPNPGKSPIRMIESYACNITTITKIGPQAPRQGWSHHFVDAASGAYAARSDPDLDVHVYHPETRGFYDWQVQDWASNGTYYCVGPYHEAAPDKGGYSLQVAVPHVAYDHGMERVKGRDNATLVAARHFSWNQTNVPEGCAFEGVDLWVLPIGDPADATWAPLYMKNTDTGCDWISDTVETYWTGYRPFDAASDAKMVAMPPGCATVAPPCPKCDLDCSNCVHGPTPATCEAFGSDPAAASCPCMSVATCAEWAPKA